METLGINIGFLLIQIFNIAVLLGWIVLGIYSALILQKSALSTEMKVLWGIAIIAIPLLGALAFLLLHAKDKIPSPPRG